MNRLIRLVLILALCLGTVGFSILAQDTEPEATEEVDTEDSNESSDMQAEDAGEMLDSQSNTEIVGLDANFEGSVSFVRFLHFVPDASADVYFDGELSDTTSFEFMESGNWLVVPAGDHTVAVTAEGASVEDALWTGTVSLPANEPVIVAVVANDDSDTLTAVVVTDDYGEVLPSVGTINFINAMSDETAVNLLRDDVVFIAGVPSPDGDVMTVNNSIPVDSDTYRFSLSISGTDVMVDDENAILDLAVRDEDNYLIVATGTQSNPHLIVFETEQAQVEVMRGNLEAPGTVLDVLRAEGYDDLVTWIDDAGLTDALNGEGPFTIFVPAPEYMDELANYEDVAAVLQNHVIDGDYRSSDIVFGTIGSVMSISGNNLVIGTEGNNLMIGDAQIIEVNHMATNGVVHVINRILEPETLP